MATLIKRVQRLESRRLRVSFDDLSEVIVPTLIDLPPFGAVRVRGSQVFHDGKLVVDLKEYMVGGEPC